MTIPYFPFYPQEWLSDPKVAQLNYEEKGVYFDMLCRMWTMNDGSCSLPDDPTFMCRLLKINPAKWKKIRAILIDGFEPVFYLENNRILNKRLLKEHLKAIEKSEKAKASVAAREQKKSEKKYDDEKNNTSEIQNPITTENKKEATELDKPLINNDCDLSNDNQTIIYKDKDKDKDKDKEYINNNVQESKPEKKPSNDKPPSQKNKFSEDDLKLAKFIFKKIRDINPKESKPNFEGWANTIRLTRERDERTHKEIQDIFLWANNHHFWQPNIRCPTSLRKQFTKLEDQRKRESSNVINFQNKFQSRDEQLRQEQDIEIKKFLGELNDPDNNQSDFGGNTYEHEEFA